MTRPIENFTIKSDGAHHDTVTTHPAFAQIGAYRTSGGHTALYGSDFNHNAYMTIRISRSELRRGLHRDWHYGRQEIVEVALSEAQWATFVSSPNVGSGVPCTLQALQGVTVPGLPDPTNRSDQFRQEMREKLERSVQKVADTLAGLDALGLPKGKTATLRDTLKGLLTELHSNIPFAASQFEEHMEDTVEKAKQEVHGYMVGVLQRAGIEAIASNMPLALTQDNNLIEE